MHHSIKALIAGAGLIFTSSAGFASCGIEKGSIRILGNDFPALHAWTTKANECAGGAVTFAKNHTKDHESLAVPALKANPAEYTSAIVANSSLLPLLNNGLIRPLDAYVATFGASLAPNQLISFDGKVMAVAVQVNAQHLFYREDILKAAGVAPPKTYEEMLAAAKAIKDKGLMQYPIGGTFKAGWNLAQEFVNMYIGHGGVFFKPGSAEPAVNNDQGVASLNVLKQLSTYMNPDYLTFDSNALQAEFQAGKVAMAVFWGSRAASTKDPKAGTQAVADAVKFTAAPTVAGGSIPATTLWWDGFTISKNASDQDAEATFRALVHGASLEMATANAEKGAWLVKGFAASPLSVGVLETAKSGAKPYPSVPTMDMMHSALGGEVAEFMQGKKDAKATLAAVEARYVASAKEKGFLK